MKLHVLLSLPQDDDSIYRILENGNDNFQEFLEDISKMLLDIHSKTNTRLYYTPQNIIDFLDYVKHWNPNDKYISKAKIQLQSLLKKTSIDITTNSKKDTQCTYILWNYDKLLTIEHSPEAIAEIAERFFSFPHDTYLLLNISEHIKACRNVLLVCKDAKHIPDLPKFARIPFVTDKEELELWLATNHVAKFSLLDKNSFSRTTYIEQGQIVFQEISTKHYWYLDAFHNQKEEDKHYEVFNANGKHIGAANLEGVLNTTKKENGRKIDI